MAERKLQEELQETRRQLELQQRHPHAARPASAPAARPWAAVGGDIARRPSQDREGAARTSPRPDAGRASPRGATPARYSSQTGRKERTPLDGAPAQRDAAAARAALRGEHSRASLGGGGGGGGGPPPWGVGPGGRALADHTAVARRNASPGVRAPSPRPRPENFTPLYKSVRDAKVIVGLQTLSLSNQYLTSLQGLGVQPQLRTLFLQNNFLRHLDYLQAQPRMRELHLEHNALVSLRGMAPQPHLERIWIAGGLPPPYLSPYASPYRTPPHPLYTRLPAPQPRAPTPLHPQPSPRCSPRRPPAASPA
jgi:hypothetical protein